MENLDPIKGAFMSLARGAEPYVDYERLYRCKLLKQHASLNRVDVAPEDPRLPQMSNIPLKVGIPGLDVTLQPGHWLTLWFDNGRPNRPRVGLWDPGEPTKPIKVSWHGQLLELGGDALVAAMDGVVRAATPCQFTGAPHFVGGKTSLVVLAKERP